VAAAFAVDHIVPHRGDRRLLLDRNNLQSLCQRCHDSHKQGIERRGYDTTVDASGWPVDSNHPVNKQKIFK
jgi:5-methylcytosine-specific restriction endonuclease McrA